MSDQSTSETQQETLPQPPPESRQFDFWVGDWDLSWADGKRGTNHIARIMEGHVVQENFDGAPASPFKGMSVTTYDITIGKWRQTWVDNAGGYLDFTGGMSGDQMILSRDGVVEGKPVKQRMVWLNIGPDSLDWHWDRSEDGGSTWVTVWDIHYVRK